MVDEIFGDFGRRAIMNDERKLGYC